MGDERKNVTLRLDSELYDDYSRYCKTEGIVLSRQIEKFLKKEMEDVKRKK